MYTGIRQPYKLAQCSRLKRARKTAMGLENLFNRGKSQYTVKTSTNRGSDSSDISDISDISDVENGRTLKHTIEWNEVYKPNENYENYSVFDPNATYTEEEEKAVVRKIDIRIMAWVLVMFFALQLDRGNIGQAIAGNFLKDNHITTNEYNNGQMLFLVAFLFMELPSQLISKKFGPDRWIPIQLMLWSIVAMLQCKVTGKKSFYGTRVALGLVEGGFIPDTVLFLSYYYTGKELPIRLSWFWGALTFTTIVGGFIGFGLLHAESGGLAGWQFVFLIEGALTFVVGVISFFYLTPSVTQKNLFSKIFKREHFFTHREQVIIVNRVLRDDPSKGDMHNREGLTAKEIWETLSNYHLWPTWIAGIIIYCPTAPPGSYLTIILKELGFGTFNTSLLTIPPNVAFIIIILIYVYLSERFPGNNRFFFATLQVLWPLFPLIALATIPETTAKWSEYAILFFILCGPYCHPILVALNSRNANTVRARTVASSAYNIFVQVGSIISTQIYRSDDAPMYRRGNHVLIGLAAAGFVILTASHFYYKHVNAKRDKIWNAMTEEEQLHYLKTTTDKGNHRLDFRFAH